MTQIAVKERGIIFTAWSIPKIMDGTKTVTRRTYGLEFVNQDPDAFAFIEMQGNMAIFHQMRPSNLLKEFPRTYYSKVYREENHIVTPIKCPYGAVGDRLYIKEAWQYVGGIQAGSAIQVPVIKYKADGYVQSCEDGKSTKTVIIDAAGKWRSSMFMPRWASRIGLEITEVRAERLQGISVKDARAEGTDINYRAPLMEFRRLWDSLNFRRGYGWDFNPWVWVIDFKLLT